MPTLLAALLCGALVASPKAFAQQAPAGSQDLFAAGPTDDGDVFWVARVAPKERGEGVETRLYLRRKGGRLGAFANAAFPRRAVSVTTQYDRVVLLFDDGQWHSATPSGVLVMGPSVPVEGTRLLSLAGDRETLLAVARLAGGAAAFPRPPTRPAATTQAGAASRPATAPATAPTVANAAVDFGQALAAGTTQASTTQPTTGPSPVAAPATRPLESLALLSYSAGRWSALADIPAEVAGTLDTVSVAIYGGVPWLAVRSSPTTLQIYRLQGAKWTLVQGTSLPASTRAAQFVHGVSRPTVWLSPASDGQPDRLYLPTTDEPASQPVTRPADAPGRVVPGTAAVSPTVRAIGYAWERFRAVRFADDSLVERAHDRDSLEAVGTESTLAVAPVSAPIMVIIRYAVLASAMVATLLLVLRRREAARDEPPIDPDMLPLASIGQRMLAGLIDAIPVVIAVAYHQWNRLSIDGDDSIAPTQMIPSTVLIGFALFLTHTTLSEVLTGRTLGKALCRLRVTTVDGERPTRKQLLTRNLLRVIDFALNLLPLVLVAFHPLRQRLGDLAAGTIVTSTDPEVPSQDTEEER
jgi:uncharacterized RDD family membrane protein YckC